MLDRNPKAMMHKKGLKTSCEIPLASGVTGEKSVKTMGHTVKIIIGTARKKNIKPKYDRGCASASLCSGRSHL